MFRLRHLRNSNNSNFLNDQNMSSDSEKLTNLNQQRKTNNYLNLNPTIYSSRTNNPVEKTKHLKLDNGHLVRVLPRGLLVHNIPSTL